MKNWKRRISCFLMGCMVLGLLNGCGKTTDETTDDATNETDEAGTENAESVSKDAEQKEIKIWTFLNPDDESGRGYVLGQARDKYNQLYPDVKVTIESMDWDTIAAKIFAASQSGGETPDVLFMESSNIGQAIDLGIMEPFENLFMSEWTDEELEDLNDVRFDYASTEDEHYQVFLFSNVYGILYRADLFEEFGIDSNFESWDELIEAAEKLTYVNEDGMQVYGLGVGYSEDAADSCYVQAQIYTEFGNCVDENGEPAWDSEVGQAALQTQIDMIDTYGVTPASAISASMEDMYADFIAGKYAMVFGGSVRVPTVKSQCVFDPDDVKLMAYPNNGDKVGKGRCSGWGIGVYSGSENKEEAGRFVEVLCSPEIDELWVTEGGQIPLRKSTVETCGDYLAEPANEYLVKAMDMIQNEQAAIDSCDYLVTGHQKDVVRAMQLAYIEGMSVEDALTTTADEFRERNGN